MMSGYGFVLCVSVILSTLLLPTWAFTLPGYDTRFELRICKDQIGGNSIRCEFPTFIWIHEEYEGYTPNYESGGTSCSGGSDNCRVQVFDQHLATTYATISSLSVSNVSVPCDNTVYEANYLTIYYSCINNDQFDRIDMCSSSTNVQQGSVYLTTPNFPLGVPPSDHDCTCYIQSSTNPGGQFRAQLYLMYTSLPEPTFCGEQTWVEVEDGLEITRKCSPFWTPIIHFPLQASRITFRFAKNASSFFQGGASPKVWYGVDADIAMSITCQEGGVSGRDPGSIDVQAGPTSAGAIVMEDVVPESTKTPEDGSFATTTLVAIVAAVAVVLVTAMVAVAIVCVKRSRKPATKSPPLTTTEVPGPPAETMFTLTDPDDYEQIEYIKMMNRASGFLNTEGQLQEGDYIGAPPKPPTRPPFLELPDALDTKDGYVPVLPASHARAADLPPDLQEGGYIGAQLPPSMLPKPPTRPPFRVMPDVLATEDGYLPVLPASHASAASLPTEEADDGGRSQRY